MRSCDDCRRYVHHESGDQAGKPDEMPKSDGKGGVVFLPMVRDANCDPPCDECPKIPPEQPEKHWRHAVQFEGWFFAAWRHFEEGRAVGDLKDADPLMRSVYAVLHRHAERLTAREFAEPVIDVLVKIASALPG